MSSSTHRHTDDDELPPKRTRLAPIAVGLTVVIIIAFGICAANFNLEGASPPVVTVAIVIEIAAIIALIVLGVIAIVRRR